MNANNAALWICLLLGAFIIWLFINGWAVRMLRRDMETRIRHLENENAVLRSEVNKLKANPFPWITNTKNTAA